MHSICGFDMELMKITAVKTKKCLILDLINASVNISYNTEDNCVKLKMIQINQTFL